ncbi:MAG: hypothetical protein DRP15_00410 [Candidatus Aenigmatarchaeota archaeon]|nr:MAG: hypothetical protein DRP15_00410 [Candidatus Aenigmarchaeota archaeon]
MMKHLRKIRKSRVTKEEVIADAIFLFVSAFVSLIVVFLFDIHHSFYEWPFTLKFIFKRPEPYLFFTPIGMLVGFFIIKLLLIGIKEEERK